MFKFLEKLKGTNPKAPDAQESVQRMKKELSIGRGGRLWPRPVNLEPTYTPFDPLSPQMSRPPPGGRPEVKLPELRFLRVNPSDDDDYSLALAEELILSFYSLRPAFPVSYEIIGVQGEVRLQLSCPSQDTKAIASQIEAFYPWAAVFESEDILKGLAPQLKTCHGYRLRRSHLFPIREPQQKIEPLTPIIGFLSSLDPGQAAIVQVLFIPANPNWTLNIVRLANNPQEKGKSRFADLPQLPKYAERKTSKPIFAVGLRIAASSKETLARLEGFLSAFDGEENGFEPMPMKGPYPLEAIHNKRITYSRGILLNSAELATLVHIPNPDEVPEALEVAMPGAAPPALAREDLYFPLGVNHYRGVATSVGISAEQSTRHVALYGGTGSGKTNLMVIALGNHIDQGGGIAVNDYKGELADRILDRIPQHRIKDVVWFDPTDSQYSPAYNPLKKIPGISNEELTSGLMVGFHRLFHGNTEFGPRMEWYASRGIQALLSAEGERTLQDLMLFFDDASFRDSLLATVKNRMLQEFWQRRKLERVTVDALLSRLSSFLDRPTIRDVLTQPNLIDIRQIMHEQKIFIARLEKGVLQDATFVLGSFIFSMLQLAAMSRRPDERHLYPIVVDEFHNLAGPRVETGAIETFLREGRSYKAPLWIATQEVATLKREVLAALGNAGTLGCMKVSQYDAQLVARELGDFSDKDVLDLGIGEIILRIGAAKDSFNSKIPLFKPGKSYRDEIIAHSQKHYYRPKSEIEAMRNQALESAPDKVLPQKKSPEALPQPTIAPDGLRMLEHLAENADTVAALYKALGIGVSRGENTRQQLRDQELIVEVETRFGKRNRPAVYLVPTMKALEAINRKPHSGRGGSLHRHFQELISTYAQGLGYKAQKERRLESGDSVDVHLTREGTRIAVEIAIHSRPKKELHNIRKCLDAGYPQILALFLEPTLLQKTKALFGQDATEEDRRKVTFGEVGRLPEYLT